MPHGSIKRTLRKIFNTAALGLTLSTVTPFVIADMAVMNNAQAADAQPQTTLPVATTDTLPPAVVATAQNMFNIAAHVTNGLLPGVTPHAPVVRTYILRPVAISAFAPLFSTDDEKERNVFFHQNRQSIAEYKVLTNAQDVGKGLTRAELKSIHTIAQEAKADVKKYKIPLPVAETLRFAAQQTGVDYASFMTRLSKSAGNLAAADPAGLSKTDVFKFNVATWLYLVKSYGAAHGLGYFAGKITTQKAADGRTLTSVADAATLRQIADMRHNPRLSALMGAEYIKNEAVMPVVSYKGITYSPNPLVAQRQTALITLGFDLGTRGADGNLGPLTTASWAEFIEMSRPLLKQGQSIDVILSSAVRQALADARAYTTQDRTITPANAFAIRHASKVVGSEFGYMMELAQAESGFDETASASTSSAAGLYQFTDQSWLMMLAQNGAKYGLADVAGQISVSKDRDGNPVYDIDNPFMERYALSLRNDPRLCALMGAEYAKTNKQDLKAALPRTTITRTDQYLAHFLGSGSAARFISHMENSPNRAANRLFPAPARSNESIFFKRNGHARSLKEIYTLFSHKFDTGVFDPLPLPPQPAHVARARPKPARR